MRTTESRRAAPRWPLGIAALAALCCGVGNTAAAPEGRFEADNSGDLAQLMALLAQRRHAQATFEQTQYLALLKHPIRSSGVLSYDAPDHLEQRTLEPRPQAAVLDHGILTVRLGTRERTLDLKDYPQLAPLLDGLCATLAGDRQALERGFALEFTGNVAQWQLVLRPLDAQLGATLERISLRGRGAAVLEMEVRQRDGDHSLLHITPFE